MKGAKLAAFFCARCHERALSPKGLFPHPSDIKTRISIDMFGRGPEPVLLALREQVHNRDLSTFVTINDALPHNELIGQMASYDAGLAWVPSEIFDHSPSLKMLEYFAAGLVPIGTSTAAHRRDVASGFKAILFEENIQSFTAAMERAVTEGFAASDIEHNLRLIQARDYEVIAREILLPAFEALTGGTSHWNSVLNGLGILFSWGERWLRRSPKFKTNVDPNKSRRRI